MKKAFFVLFVVTLALGLFVWKFKISEKVVRPLQENSTPSPKPLDKYTIETLAVTDMQPSPITIGKTLSGSDDSEAYVFYYYVDNKRASGILNIPKAPGSYPVIVMFRGYVDREQYSSGIGSQPSAQVFAKNGFITLAPDFLGYGESDNPSASPIEERFQTYITATTLLASVVNLNTAFETNNISVRVTPDKVGIWGHSNGGQIALTVLEITGGTYPTVLWAPVSKSFPYSILYYTDEFDDQGKLLRKVVSDFEKDYDSDKYSLTNYFDRINATIQIHQGGADEEVPLKWSNNLTSTLKKLNKNVQYFTYDGANHNLQPTAWNTSVSRSLEFYKKILNQ